jgi:hypothetical protein
VSHVGAATAGFLRAPPRCPDAASCCAPARLHHESVRATTPRRRAPCAVRR